MKKFAKKLAVLATVLCVALTCALFAACGDGEDADENTVTYTVTVNLPNGENAGAGVAVGFCTNTCVNVLTNENGVATFDGEKGVNYHVQISYGCPAGYYAPDYTAANEEPSHYVENWEGTSYTIVLTEKPAE